jgi:hypothetical protein
VTEVGRHRAAQPLLELFREPRHRVERRRDRALVDPDEARALEPSDFLGEGAHRDASTFREHSYPRGVESVGGTHRRAAWASQRRER